MSYGQIASITAMIRELMDILEQADRGHVHGQVVLKMIDQIEDNIDLLIQQLAPERITDERFQAVMKAVDELSEILGSLRKAVTGRRYKYATKLAMDLQEKLRKVYRLMMLIRSGGPSTVIFQVAPHFVRDVNLRVPEPLLYASPLAVEIYNRVVRRGSVPVDELIVELGIDERRRDEFNRAITSLITMGYVVPYIDRDNRMILKVAR